MAEFAANFLLNNDSINTEFNLSEGAQFDALFEIYASGTVWGSISGTLSNQTDLQAALDLKADKTELNTAIQNEAATRAENDTLLQNNINTLSQTVTANYNTLDGKIDTEISNRTASDTTLQGNIDTLSGTVTSNYNALDARITTNTGNISDINTTLSGYGNIVTHNVSEFATSAQGALADTALQPNDNISELVNDVGYITSASLPTDYVPETRTINGYALSSNITLNYTDVGALSASTTINDLTTIAQQNALNSGATTTNIGQITTNANNISDIQDLIPNQASSSNQLADKDFVNSSIATNTANFIGTFNSVAELEAYTGTLTNNDYAFVATTDTAGNTLYDRYKYNADTQEWLFEYELNNSSFTAQQWASINSGITSGDVTLIGTALQPNDNISELTNDVGYITSASLPIVNNGTLDIQVNGTSVGTFTANQSGNTTANIVVPDSATWGNITGTLSNQTDLQTALNSKLSNSGNGGNRSLGIMGTITSSRTEGTWIGYSSEAANWSTACGFQAKATGQTSIAIGWNAKATSTNSIQIGYGTNSTPNTLSIGFNNTSYTLLNGITGLIPDARISSDIARTSQIPTNNNQLTNGAGYITGITSSDVTTALGYTPYNATNPNGYITASALTPYALSADLSTVATSGDYDDLINKPTIPTVNNGTLTIQKNGTTIGTFTANQSGNSTINIEADTVLTDDITVSKNSDDELQAIGVIDNNSGNALKYWTGTKAQYDAIVTKDPNQLYFIEDDTDTTLTLLELLFPVGAVYFGTMATCPLQTLGVGTWQALPPDKVIQIAGTRGSVGDTLNESLPNIKGTARFGDTNNGSALLDNVTGAIYTYQSSSKWAVGAQNPATNNWNIGIDASRSSSTYQDNAPVQPDAYLLNGWRRIA